MNCFSFVFFCSAIIFGATSLGSLLVIGLNVINDKTEKICLGLASGIMFAASIWSLLLPALDSSNIVSVLIGFVIGVFVIIQLDRFVNKYSSSVSKKNTMLFLAMSIHNIPEGMTVGLMSAYAYQSNSMVSVSAALALTIGIAIQNIPEGAAISLNYRQDGYSKLKSAFLGIISGVVEPISAFLMLILINYLSVLLPFVLSGAAAIMIYVVIGELLPSISKEKSNFSCLCFIGGFLLMMCLDVLL